MLYVGACKAHNPSPSLDIGSRSCSAFNLLIMSDDLRATTISVNLTLIVLTSLAISCRIGRKLRILSSFGWHDGKLSSNLSCSATVSAY